MSTLTPHLDALARLPRSITDGLAAWMSSAIREAAQDADYDEAPADVGTACREIAASITTPDCPVTPGAVLADPWHAARLVVCRRLAAEGYGLRGDGSGRGVAHESVIAQHRADVLAGWPGALVDLAWTGPTCAERGPQQWETAYRIVERPDGTAEIS
jgi:hypothetical protein